MKISDQDKIQLHEEGTVTAVSNNDGVFAYFTDEKVAEKFATMIINTHRRVELLMEMIDFNGEVTNDLEKILSELEFAKKLYK